MVYSIHLCIYYLSITYPSIYLLPINIIYHRSHLLSLSISHLLIVYLSDLGSTIGLYYERNTPNLNGSYKYIKSVTLKKKHQVFSELTFFLKKKKNQILLFIGFFRSEYWSGLPSLSPGDLPDPSFHMYKLLNFEVIC